ncbi:MAG: indole-3-glycerol-phosphate synthase [Gammaproteobacteria bacterium]|nr:indole-3-glycerol-phosphate synthase [Gammaproteobacteria bacterium]MCP4089964.1 indole-3-glycerol-phosphate synthase [Gammaproteobacteria bacterium]MCP4276295.1 indole-3-glycerol-phosphate synthase [Gammaproteobacteria bacterium]MCP4831290.1 indole-3-glycerol-phosphate synthase [Gammaproteobacteria bacterium]MCP4928773.1 indole-3-glycerol-phosphate synthase [Gammaproteobacteria bacterium]
MNRAANSDFLLGMAHSSKQRHEIARATLSDAQQRSQLLCLNAPHDLQLSARGFDLIAEIKKRSPAEGDLDAVLASSELQAEAYVRGGAAVLSVLTEPDKFSGSLNDLHAVAENSTPVPVMRKDFLVSCYQVREARLAGASGVLLIAAILDADQMASMLETAFELGLFVLMEVFDQADLDKCVPVLEQFGAALKDGRCHYLLGVNCRDLRTLQVNFGHFQHMAPRLPTDMPWVAESGVTDEAQIKTLVDLGYRLALVGTALMRSGDPAATVASWKAAGLLACS